MTKLSLAIRTDSSKKIGTGNIKRAILIAKEFKKKNFRIHFIKKNTEYNSELKKLGFEIFVIKKKYNFQSQILKYIDKKKILAYYTDLLTPEIKIEKSLKKKIPVVVFEDEINKHFCHLYFNPNTDKSKDSHLIKKKIYSEKNYLGKKYFIIKKIKKKKYIKNKKILVSFGGSDNSNQTEKVIRALKIFFNTKYKIFVCLGKNYKFKNKLKTKYKNIDNLKFFSSENLSEILSNFNFIIGSCGQSLLERIYLSKYSLSAITSGNQYLLAKKIKKFNVTKIINLSYYPKKIKLSNWRKEIIDYLRMNNLQIKSKKFFIKNNVAEVIKIIVKKIHDR